MKPHFEQTIAELQASRARLEDLIQTLTDFANAVEPSPGTPTGGSSPAASRETAADSPPPRLQSAKRGRPPKEAAGGRQKKPRAVPAGGKSIRDCLRPIIAKMNSPFTMKELKAAAREKLSDQWDDRQITNGCDQTARQMCEEGGLEKIEEKPPTFARSSIGTVGPAEDDEVKRRGRPPKAEPDKFEANKIASELIRAAITKSSEPFTSAYLVAAIEAKIPEGINAALAVRNALNRYVQLDYVREINGGYKRSPSWQTI
jgi:hypothetical protein